MDNLNHWTYGMRLDNLFSIFRSIKLSISRSDVQRPVYLIFCLLVFSVVISFADAISHPYAITQKRNEQRTSEWVNVWATKKSIKTLPFLLSETISNISMTSLSVAQIVPWRHSNAMQWHTMSTHCWNVVPFVSRYFFQVCFLWHVTCW